VGTGEAKGHLKAKGHSESMDTAPEGLLPLKKGEGFPDIILIVLSVLVVCCLLALQHPLTLLNDNLTEILPLHVLAARAIAKGHLPLWNPYCWAGTPLLSNPQAGVLYPLHWLSVWLFGAFASMDFLLFTHIAWGFAGAYLLLRRLRYPTLSSGAGALCFVFSGFSVTTARHWLHMLEVGSWTPWILLLSHIVYTQRKGGRRPVLPMACLTLSIVLQVFAGYPEFVLYTWIFIPIFLLLFHNWSSKGTVAVLVAATAGALMASLQWLPALHEYIHSSRGGGFPLQASLALSLPLKTLMGPFIPAAKAHLPEVNKSIFSGILCWGIGFPVAILTLPKGKGKVLVLWSLFGLALLLSLGGSGYLYPVLWRFLPGFKLFRFPFKYLFIGNLALMFLVAEGWNRPGNRGHLLLWTVVGATSLLYALSCLQKSPFLIHQILFSLMLILLVVFYRYHRIMFVALVISLMLVAPIHHRTATDTGHVFIPSLKSPMADLPGSSSHRFLSLYDRHPGNTPAQYSLAWNWPAVYGTPSVNGIGAFVPDELQGELGIGNEIQYKKALSIIESPQILEQLSVKYLIFIKGSPLYSLINKLDPSRFRICAENRYVTVVSYNNAKRIADFTNTKDCAITSETVLSDGVYLETNGKKTCKLSLSTSTKEGWHASTSDRPLPISKTSCGIMVSLPKGTHQLFLSFIPPWTTPALYIGIAGIIIFIIFVLFL